MIKVITFEDSEWYYGETAKEKLEKWSETVSQSQVISIQFHDGGKISVFYWKS